MKNVVVNTLYGVAAVVLVAAIIALSLAAKALEAWVMVKVAAWTLGVK